MLGRVVWRSWPYRLDVVWHGPASLSFRALLSRAMADSPTKCGKCGQPIDLGTDACKQSDRSKTEYHKVCVSVYKALTRRWSKRPA